MSQRIRVAIIGTGFGARAHAPLFNRHPGFEVAAISSVARGRLEEIRQVTGIDQVYDNWEKMLAEQEVDLISVVSAPDKHHDMVLSAFQKGVHVLCEKPMAMTAKEAKTMIAARDAAGRLGFINFEFRFLPARLKVKEILESGRLGRLLHVSYSCNLKAYQAAVSQKRGWLGQRETGGGFLGAIGSHMVDSLRWWMSAEVQSLSGQLSTHISEWVGTDGEREVRTADDTFQVIGTFAGGTTFQTQLMYASRHGDTAWRLEIYGTEGTLIMTDDQQVKVGLGDEPLTAAELQQVQRPEGLSAYETRYYDAFYPMLDRLYAAIAEGKTDTQMPTFEDGYQVQRVLDAVRQSHDEGKRISL